MSVEAITAVWRLDLDGLGADVSAAAAALVLVNLADRADRDGVCWPSQARVARDTNLGLRTVTRVVAALRERGLVEVEPCYRGGRRRSNRYRLTFAGPVDKSLPPTRQGGVLAPAYTPGWRSDTRQGGVAEPSLEPSKELPDVALALLGRLGISREAAR